MTNALPIPLDIKLMNATAAVLFVALAVTGLATGLWWAVRHPVFSISGILVQGDVVHNNAMTLRANVAPRLTGNFFTLDLASARAAFEAVPWVRKAVVRREFPNRLRVVLQEHEAVAYWGAEADSRLLNNFGEVFEANTGDVEAEGLPRLQGPDGQSAQVLEMYRTVSPLIGSVEGVIETLELSARGGWRVHLDSGAVIELGRGTPQEVALRAERFVRTVTQVTSKYGRTTDSVASADLRHSDGYALRLRGVTTVVSDDKKTKP
jgi:cell division protein FtsQ